MTYDTEVDTARQLSAKHGENENPSHGVLLIKRESWHSGKPDYWLCDIHERLKEFRSNPELLAIAYKGKIIARRFETIDIDPEYVKETI